jgi:hypothetical protein
MQMWAISKHYCTAAMFPVLFVCGVFPPPPLESRLYADGASKSPIGFFSARSLRGAFVRVISSA